jgi:hypothetical protein
MKKVVNEDRSFEILKCGKEAHKARMASFMHFFEFCGGGENILI